MPRGHVQQRANGTYRVHVYAGRDPITKKQLYLSETAPDEGTAERLRTKLLAQIDAQRRPNTNATVRYLLERWLEVADIEASTRRTYEVYIATRINPTLGDEKIRRLNVEKLDRFYVHLRKHGGRCQRCKRLEREGKPPMRAGQRFKSRPEARTEQVHEPDCARGLPLASATVRQIHFILRAAFRQAVKWEWLDRNPAELATPPGITRPEGRPPSLTGVEAILSHAWSRDPDFGTYLWLAPISGARRGELCALRWRHVRFEDRTLFLHRNYVLGQEKDTKNHQHRRIALDDTTTDILTAHLQRCRERAEFAGIELSEDAFVFSDDGVTPWRPDRITQRFRRLSKRVGVETTLHQFSRHFSATYMLADGVDLRTAAGRLGHGDGGSTTLRVYASPVTESDRRAAEHLARRLPRLPFDAQPSAPTTKPPGRPSRLSPNLVAEITTMRQTMTLPEIAATLTDRAIPSPTGRTEWTASMVKHALRTAGADGEARPRGTQR